MVATSHRIVIAGSISDHVVMNSSKVFLFDQEYGLSQEQVILIATSYVHRYLCMCVDKSHNHVDNEWIYTLNISINKITYSDVLTPMYTDITTQFLNVTTTTLQ